MVTKEKDTQETWQEQLLRICGIDVTTCPVCKKGRMLTVEFLPPSRCKRSSGTLQMSTADVKKTISPSHCENSIQFRLNLLLSEIAPLYACSRQQAHPTVSLDTAIDLIQAGATAIPPKKYTISK
jgi:hypothetical protein